MPTYLYKCMYCSLQEEVNHKAYDLPVIRCESCNVAMIKAPQQVAINWNGPKPSDGGITPLVKNMIADAPRQRDEMQARKEEDGND